MLQQLWRLHTVLELWGLRLREVLRGACRLLGFLQHVGGLITVLQFLLWGTLLKILQVLLLLLYLLLQLQVLFLLLKDQFLLLL